MLKLAIRLLLFTLASLGLPVCLTTAHAQGRVADKATAEALFDQGLALMREGRFEQACARFERSQAIERGLGTMLYLADCYERVGRTATAWALFREAASMADAAGQRERAVAGTKRAEALKPKLAHITVQVEETRRRPGLRVTRNGATLPESLWGIPLPVDPGDHALRVSAPGHATIETTVRVQAGPSQLEYPVPELKPLATASASASEAPSSSLYEVAPSAVARASAAGDTQRMVGLITAGAGAVSVVVGAVFGTRAIVKDNEAEEFCVGNSCTDPQGVVLTDEAISAATASTVAFTVGACLITGGLAAYLLAPEQERATLSMAADTESAMLQLRGVF